MSAFSESVFDAFMWLIEHVVITIVVIGLCLFLLASPFLLYGCYKQAKSPTFTLYKNQWACTNMQRIPITTYVQSGNVMIPVTTYSDECHQWSKQP